MTDYENDKEETKATERPPVPGCGKDHACDKTEAEEIEVTPEMIEAGALALARYTSFYDTLEEGAEKIFKAMISSWSGKAGYGPGTSRYLIISLTSQYQRIIIRSP